MVTNQPKELRAATISTTAPCPSKGRNTRCLTFDSLLYSTTDRIYDLAAHTRSALMAPMAVYNSHSLKRTSSTADFGTPPAKKLNRGPIRHHKLTWETQRKQRLNSSWQDEESTQSLLTRSIGLALEAVGFEASDPDAIESFRGDVEECMRSCQNSLAVLLEADRYRHGPLFSRCAAVHALLSSHATNTPGLLTSSSHASAQSTIAFATP